jgi:hypothetical protein
LHKVLKPPLPGSQCSNVNYVDRETGELIPCEILVSAMPYSHFIHAVALPSQKQPDFIAGMVKAINYLEAVPHT